MSLQHLALFNVFRFLTPLFMIASGFFLGDFLITTFHHFKDTWGSPHTPVTGPLFIHNSRAHHVKPRAILQVPDSKLVFDSTVWTLFWMWPLFCFRQLMLLKVSVLAVLSMNDVVHKYSHIDLHSLSDEELLVELDPKNLDNTVTLYKIKLMRFLQKHHLFQSYSDHHLHHRENHDSHYSPINPLTNIILEKIQFWRGLEAVIYFLFGIVPRSVEYKHELSDKHSSGVIFTDEIISQNEYENETIKNARSLYEAAYYGPNYAFSVLDSSADGFGGDSRLGKIKTGLANPSNYF